MAHIGVRVTPTAVRWSATNGRILASLLVPIDDLQGDPTDLILDQAQLTAAVKAASKGTGKMIFKTDEAEARVTAGTVASVVRRVGGTFPAVDHVWTRPVGRRWVPTMSSIDPRLVTIAQKITGSKTAVLFSSPVDPGLRLERLWSVTGAQADETVSVSALRSVVSAPAYWADHELAVLIMPINRGDSERQLSLGAHAMTLQQAAALTSRWMRDRYNLVAMGPLNALRWMFPNHGGTMEMVSPVTFRRVFTPSPHPVTVERSLRQICTAWQEAWDRRLEEEVAGLSLRTSASPDTLKEAYEHHQAHYVALLGARTSEQYPARMEEWFKYLGGDTRLEDITAEVILAARARMQKDRKSSNTTINGKVSTLKKILNMAHRKGWVTRSPWRDVPPLRLVRPPVRYWNADQIAVAFAVAKEDSEPGRAILMLVLGIFLGLRKNEAVHVRWKDLLLDRPHPKTGLPSPICLIEQREGFTTKTYENRKVPVSSEAVRLLREYRPVDADPDDYVLDAERHHQKRGGTKRVYRYDPVKVWRRVLKAAIARGNPHIEFKEMRHSFACNCLQRGHNVEKVARWLGHKDPRMVRQHYAFLLDYDEDTGLAFLEDE